MRKIKLSENSVQRITVDIKGLQDMLSLGRCSADKLAENAGAVVRVGKRKLYNVSKIEAYINSHEDIDI